MDLVILIGMLGGIGFIVMVMIFGGDFSMFVDVLLVFIVFCGSLFVVML